MSARNPKVVDGLIPEIHVTEESPDGTVHEIEIAGVTFRRYPGESEGAGAEVERLLERWKADEAEGMMADSECNMVFALQGAIQADRAAFRQGVDCGDDLSPGGRWRRLNPITDEIEEGSFPEGAVPVPEGMHEVWVVPEAALKGHILRPPKPAHGWVRIYIPDGTEDAWRGGHER